VFAATPLCSDGAGLHRIGSVEDRFASIGMSLLQHMNRCGVNTFLFEI
jgi:hypothetical protein